MLCIDEAFPIARFHGSLEAYFLQPVFLQHVQMQTLLLRSILR